MSNDSRDKTICANCYEINKGEMPGHFLIELTLWLAFFPLGIFYTSWRRKHRYSNCPTCHGKGTMIPVTSPKGQILAKESGVLPGQEDALDTQAMPKPLGPIKKALIKLGKGVLYFFIGLILLSLIISMFEDTPQDKMAKATKLSAEKIQAQYREDPAAFILRVEDLIKKSDFTYARSLLDRAGQPSDPKIVKLRQNLEKGLALEAAREEKASRKIKASQNLKMSAAVRALDKCKAQIARFINADGASQIPDVESFGSGNEFVYGWPKGQFAVATTLGTFPISASCDGTLSPIKIMSLSVNGETLILGGEQY